MTRGRAGTLVALTASASLAMAMACGSVPDPSAPTVVRTDSAGVQLIANFGEDTPLPWQFDTLGSLTDSLGEPWLFTGVGPSIVTTDGHGHIYWRGSPSSSRA